MRQKIFSIPITYLKKEVKNRGNKIYPEDALHYCSPSVGGWGVVRVACLVPESVVLFVIPQGCGRHGAIASMMHNYDKQLFYLYMSQVDIVTGEHMNKIDKAVELILSKLEKKPKALVLCCTCTDDLLGSDYEGKARLLEEKFDIDVRIGRMNPIRKESKRPPELMIQKTIYDYLEAVSNEKKDTINIVGSFKGFTPKCEINTILRQAGIEEILHIRNLKTYEEYQKMSRSKYNLLIKPSGKIATKEMKRRLKIPFADVPVAYRIDGIEENYRKIEQLLGRTLEYKKYRRATEEVIQDKVKALGRLSVAVGSTANACPFELARELVERDFYVPYVFADQLLPCDEVHVDWLKENAPYITVYSTMSPTMTLFLQEKKKVDLAIGFDAGYFCSGSKTVPLSLDEQLYGYEGAKILYSRMIEVFEKPQDLKKEMYQSGMVI
ncbi:nitrogenase component 1 [Paramaledivibacter caminithermalis]|jgi:nitrogenase molybdenum-cofactor synthesis protein NifE|uniref:Nitrogenase molybdenum-cofactor synthesis protein NifE n=1 Tax=Paramaledivibacter caminithermalis (strain DSM 15212 / CIP 107654 / DViRD3) TaxID=1121301 RepID=A0A1M6P2K4_PARC5|nr:nitrogenase component 1 [Paramaledivibacter caminithermalis]SHK02161.1 nitrogenase molybdenum-cofactor synthesis protein NifE [Paramaledivibacter caminithermalis DSM 15212]